MKYGPVRHPEFEYGGPPRGDAAPLDVRDMAALYAVGALTDAERDHFEALVRAGNPEAVGAAAESCRAMETLTASMPEVAPPPDAARVIRMRLGMWEAAAADAVAADRHEHHHDHDADDHLHEHAARQEALVVARRGEIKWRPTGLPGVKGCTLYADKKNNRRTVLLNMAPGSYIPDHNHAGIEEVLILEGDLSVGPIPLKAGDYFRAQPETKHGVPRTEKGCIALVFSTYSSITTRTKMGFALEVLKDLLRRGKKSA
jgi:quercetin dioxygenase-like cupin family protein